MLVGGFNPSEKYESQLGRLFSIYGKIKFMFQSPPTRSSIQQLQQLWFHDTHTTMVVGALKRKKLWLFGSKKRKAGEIRNGLRLARGPKVGPVMVCW